VFKTSENASGLYVLHAADAGRLLGPCRNVLIAAGAYRDNAADGLVDPFAAHDFLYFWFRGDFFHGDGTAGWAGVS
jgi:hypothetical protein